jgi:hypothetical protein
VLTQSTPSISKLADSKSVNDFQHHRPSDCWSSFGGPRQHTDNVRPNCAGGRVPQRARVLQALFQRWRVSKVNTGRQAPLSSTALLPESFIVVNSAPISMTLVGRPLRIESFIVVVLAPISMTLVGCVAQLEFPHMLYVRAIRLQLVSLNLMRPVLRSTCCLLPELALSATSTGRFLKFQQQSGRQRQSKLRRPSSPIHVRARS